MSIGILLIIAWFGGVVSVIAARLAWVAWQERKTKQQIDSVVRDYSRVVKATRPQMTELERRRLLRKFSEKHVKAMQRKDADDWNEFVWLVSRARERLHANAEIVELGRGEPQIRTVERWKKAP